MGSYYKNTHRGLYVNKIITTDSNLGIISIQQESKMEINNNNSKINKAFRSHLRLTTLPGGPHNGIEWLHDKTGHAPKLSLSLSVSIAGSADEEVDKQ